MSVAEVDPAVGLFISADPLLDAGSPQTMTGYTYAADDPVNGEDPTGTQRCIAAEGFCGNPGGYSNGNDPYAGQLRQQRRPVRRGRERLLSVRQGRGAGGAAGEARARGVAELGEFGNAAVG